MTLGVRVVPLEAQGRSVRGDLTKRRAGMVLLFVVLAIMLWPVVRPAPPGWRIHERDGYSIAIPEEWEVGGRYFLDSMASTPRDFSLSAYRFPGRPRGSLPPPGPSVWIFVRDGDISSAGAFARDAARRLERDLYCSQEGRTAAADREQRRAQVWDVTIPGGGGLAVQVLCEGQKAPAVMHYQVFLSDGARMYELRLRAPSDQLDTEALTLRSLLDSFRVGGPERLGGELVRGLTGRDGS